MSSNSLNVALHHHHLSSLKCVHLNRIFNKMQYIWYILPPQYLTVSGLDYMLGQLLSPIVAQIFTMCLFFHLPKPVLFILGYIVDIA